MSKYDDFYYSDSNGSNDAYSDDEENVFIDKDEFDLKQSDEHFEVCKNSYDFLKNCIDSKDYIFPIMENYDFKNFMNFLSKFLIPKK